MTKSLSVLLLLASTTSAEHHQNQPPKVQVTPSQADGWFSLFNGENLDGWRASEHQGTCRVEQGLIVTQGERSHLFYVGPVHDADFRDFEVWLEVQTDPGSNSGLFFHTAFQAEGSPQKGYEVQINQTHKDPRKTGGLFDVADIQHESPAEDGEWFSLHVVVRDKRVVVRVNGLVTTDYTEPEGVVRPKHRAGRLLDHGTIALQGHDPGSTVRFRQVWVKPLD